MSERISKCKFWQEIAKREKTANRIYKIVIYFSKQYGGFSLENENICSFKNASWINN